MKSQLFVALLFTALSFAHEGHDMPGAMPPAPHGGEVKAAEEPEGEHHHDEKKEGKEEHHDDEKGEAKGGHDHAEEKEVFFEVVYSNKLVKVYPLTLDPKNPKIFSSLPAQAFSNVEMRIELPREKKIETVKVNTKESYFEAAFDSKAAFRFFAHISGKFEGEEKKAKIQVEID